MQTTISPSGADDLAVHEEPTVRATELVIASDGTWFDRTTGDRVPLGSYRVLGALLLRLARSRLASPGQPVLAHDLVAAGWPNERIADRAARNRLRVALATLRKSGLRGALVTKDGGYMFDPALPIRLV